MPRPFSAEFRARAVTHQRDAPRPADLGQGRHGGEVLPDDGGAADGSAPEIVDGAQRLSAVLEREHPAASGRPGREEAVVVPDGDPEGGQEDEQLVTGTPEELAGRS